MPESITSLPPSKALPLTKIRTVLYLVMALLDVCALFCTVWLANAFARASVTDGRFFSEFTTSVATYVAIAATLGAYSKNAINDAQYSLKKSLHSLIITTISFNLSPALNSTIGHYLIEIFFSRFLILAVALIIARQSFDLMIRKLHLHPVENVLYVSDGSQLPRIEHRHYRLGLNQADTTITRNDPHSMDAIGRRLRNMDRLVVACTPDRRQAWSNLMKGLSFQGELISNEISTLEASGIRISPTYAALIISRPPLEQRERIIKRAFDLTIAVAGLIALAIPLAITALLIKMEDGGPVFFVQKRNGRDNQFFNILKFRSMRVESLDSDGGRSTSIDDDRVTRVGNFIRRTSIDELPQLFNVLMGDMSIVGPRPHAAASRAGGKLFYEVDQRYWQRHSLKPGLTGLAQMRGLRGTTETETDLLLRLQSDLDYVRNWTIWRDIGILVMTLKVIVHRNAY